MVKFFYFLLILFFFSVSAYAKITVYGRVTGTEGKPIPVAHVSLTYPGDDNPIKRVIVQKDGKFKIEIDSEGLWILHFTGIFHHKYPIAIYSTEPKTIQLDVKLQTYNYFHKFSSVKAIGNFNGWSLPKAINLKIDQDGNYSAIVDSKLDTVFYRLIYVRTGGKIEGTNADGYVPTGVDPKGIEGYNSFLIAKKGKVKIIFDPRKLVKSDKPASFKFASANSFESRFAKAYATLEDTRQKYYNLLYSYIDERRSGFKFDFIPYFDKVKSLMNSEPNELIRQVLQLSYYGLKYLSETGHNVNVQISRETLDGIPPNSIVWSLEPSYVSEVMNHAAFSEPEKDKYVYKVLNTNPMKRPKEILLRDEIYRKFNSLQDKELLPFLTILLDQFGDSPEALSAGKKYYSNYLKLKNGVQAPKFSVKSLLDSTQHFTNDSFLGKYYLLNFWATSNPTSIDEIANLQKAYDMYKEELTIVTISLDSTSENAGKFISKKMRMPLLNAIEEKGLDSKLCKDFEVYSIPKAVLVDPQGNIAAVGWDLRGQNLFQTLKKYLEK